MEEIDLSANYSLSGSEIVKNAFTLKASLQFLVGFALFQVSL